MGKLFDLSKEIRRRNHVTQLALTLVAIEENDQNYTERYRLVLLALHLATQLGYRAGVGFDKKEGADWPVAYIELPRGSQVSWHIPAHPHPYDGHSTPEKYARCREYVQIYVPQSIARVDHLH